MIDAVAPRTKEPNGPIWPILVAPIAAGIYYLAVKLAFQQSIVDVLGRTDFFDIPNARWGTHWVFRGVAEVIAIGTGTFVAASMAVGRQRVAGIVGGCAISVGFLIKLALAFLIPTDQDSNDRQLLEPWYQYAIDCLLLVTAPFIGDFISSSAEDLNRSHPKGIGGIARLHFIWLWWPTYLYTLGLITPVARLYGVSDSNFVLIAISLFVNGIPALAIAVPGYYGLALLSGHHGNTMHPIARNIIGSMVLLFGFLFGIFIQYAWYFVIYSIYKAIVG
jgi:hypothetical protein